MSWTNNSVKVKACRHGTFMFLQSDSIIGKSLDVYGEYSEAEIALFDQFLQSGMTIVEVGANIGAHTVYLARRVGSEGNVIAFEPQRAIFHLLCGNLALNELENVEALPIALGSGPTSLSIPPINYRRPGNFGGVELRADGVGPKVAVAQLDEQNLTHCHFIKIDVEGMELAVLAGAVSTLRIHRPIIYVENDRPAKSRELVRFLLDSKYRLFWHTPPLFNPNNFAEVGEDVFGNMISINLLCIPYESEVTILNFTEIHTEEGGAWSPA